MSWSRKLVSPSGLTLVLLLLFLPFVGVSCESGFGTIEAELSGWDMVVGGEPSLSGSGAFAEEELDSSDIPDDDLADGAIPVQPMAVITVLLVIIGAILGLALRSWFARAVTGLLFALGTVMTVVINQIVVTDDLVEEIAEDAGSGRDAAADMVGSRIGFWLTLAVLLAVGVYQILEIGKARRAQLAPASGGWPPGQYPGHGQQPQGQHPHGQRPPGAAPSWEAGSATPAASTGEATSTGSDPAQEPPADPQARRERDPQS